MQKESIEQTLMRLENKIDAILFYLDQLTNEELVLIDENEIKDGE